MVSVERIRQFSTLDDEHDDTDPSLLTAAFDAAAWPASGALSFEQVTMRYRPYDLLGWLCVSPVFLDVMMLANVTSLFLTPRPRLPPAPFTVFETTQGTTALPGRREL